MLKSVQDDRLWLKIEQFRLTGSCRWQYTIYHRLTAPCHRQQGINLRLTGSRYWQDAIYHRLTACCHWQQAVNLEKEN